MSSTVGRSLTHAGVSLLLFTVDDKKKEANLYVCCCNLFASCIVIVVMYERKKKREERAEGRRPKQSLAVYTQWRVSCLLASFSFINTTMIMTWSFRFSFFFLLLLLCSLRQRWWMVVMMMMIPSQTQFDSSLFRCLSLLHIYLDYAYL